MEPLFGNYLVAGMLDVVEDVTVYASAKDRALGVSKWVFGRERLGQIVSTDMSEAADSYLWRNGNLIIVNATDTPGADLGNVHAYFRQSPWDQQRYSGDSVVRSKARGTGACNSRKAGQSGHFRPIISRSCGRHRHCAARRLEREAGDKGFRVRSGWSQRNRQTCANIHLKVHFLLYSLSTQHFIPSRQP